MRIVAQIAIVMAILPLAGCGATSAQVQFHSDTMVMKKALADLSACISLATTGPKYTPLKSHMRVVPKQPTVAELADSSFISSGDAKLLSDYRTSIGECDTQFASEVGAVSPQLSEIVMDTRAAYNENAANLIDHKETWGKFNEKQQDIRSASQKAAIMVLNRITNALNQENQFEIQQRAQAWANFQRAMQRQEMINSMNQPRTTTCNKFGVTVSCTTE